MKKVLFLVSVLFLFSITACDDNNQKLNTCYIETSSNPCFDSNIGGETITITDQSVEEVISDLENMEGFIIALETTIILQQLAFLGPQPPDCPFEQSALVIKTTNDWDRFRNSCFFSFFELPDVNFENNTVFVSTQEFAELGTRVEAVLEFDNNISVVIEDDITNIPPPMPGFPISIVSVPRINLPADFFRVENDLTP
ncbi:MAG: hypothetical protein WBB48_12555 [Thermodesulfobacteriota bacterium]